MAVSFVSPETQKYIDGYRNGRTDRRMGIRSDYSFYGVEVETRTNAMYEYFDGYRVGWLGRKF